MAKPTTVRFGKFFVRISNGDLPPKFIAPCGFTSKSFSRSKTLSDIIIPDCDDPDHPVWLERDVISLSSTINGEGVLSKTALPYWEQAFDSGESFECEIEMQYLDGESDLYIGRFHIESLEITGSQGERVTISVTMQSDGEVESDLHPWSPTRLMLKHVKGHYSGGFGG